MIDRALIDNVYDELGKAYKAAHDAETEVTNAKRAYEQRKTQLLVAGVEGKNKKQRDAALEEGLINESRTLMMREESLAYAKLMLKLADLERSRLRMIVENEGNQVKP